MSTMKALLVSGVAILIASCGGDLLQTPPAVAPTINVSGLAATASQTTATVGWTTDVTATHLVEYGTSSGAYAFATIQSQTPGTTHSASLSGLSASTTYYYRVRNFYTNVVGSAAGVESSFTTSAQPVIQVIGTASTASQTTATVTWTTDVPTTHLVEYGTSTGAYTNATLVSQTAATAHSVPLSGLSAATTYYYRVRNLHPAMPEAVGAENTLATTAFPTIQVTGLAVTPSQTTATVTWNTDVATTHFVEYGTASGVYSLSTVQTPTPGANHSISLAGLTASTTYYYRLHNIHTSIPETVSVENTFTTTATPVIQVSGISPTASQTTATITWTTDVATTHLVEYGTVPGTYTTATIQTQASVTSHSVLLSGLAASTTYYYRVRNFHATMPHAMSAENSFATTAFPTIQVTGLAATPSQTTATITWTTDVATTHLVEYGTAPGTYSASTIQTQTGVSSHIVSLAGLTASTPYYYRVWNFHSTYPSTVSGESSLTTTASPVIQVTVAPAATPSPSSAIITWTTDVATTHLVEYGTAPGTYAYATVQSQVSGTSHSVSLSGLTGGTAYYYRVRNYHATYPATVSGENTFTTTAIQITVGPAATPSPTSATITWTTDVATTHTVEYGTASGVYDYQTTLSGAAVTSHSVVLSPLAPSIMYYYRVRNFHSTYPSTVSGENTFTTTASPAIQVTGISASGIQPSSATITWATDVAATHLVEYGTVSGTYAYATVQSTTSGTSHSVSLSGLTGGTLYYYRVRNFHATYPATVSGENTFTTTAIQITLNPAATPSPTSATITWTTDVATTHYVEYGTVTGVYDNQTSISGAAVTSHSVVLSPLVSSTQYFYRVRNFHATYPATVSGENTFTTTAPSIAVTGIAATAITASTADISWTTDVATTHLIEYGTVSGPPYSYATFQSASPVTSHTVSLSGLSTLTQYYYRIWNFHSTMPDAASGENTFTTIDATHPTLAEKLRGIWMIGGLSTNLIGSAVAQVDLFDPQSGTWYPSVTTLPAAVSFAAAESYAGKIYVIGGFNSSGVAQNIVQIYDVANNSWSFGAVMTAARANISAAVVNGRIYVLGGTTGNATGVAYGSSLTTYEYTPGADTWVQKGAFSAANLSERLAFAFNDAIYNCGGRTAAAAVAATHDSFAVTSNGISTGTTEVALSAARTGHAGVLYAPASGPAMIVVVGGFTALTCATGQNNFIVNGTTASTPSQLFQYLAYPFTLPSAWLNGGATAVYPLQIGFSSAALYGSKMYVFGGTTTLVSASAGGLGNVNWFDLTQPSVGNWTAATSMPVVRYGHAAVTVRQ